MKVTRVVRQSAPLELAWTSRKLARSISQMPSHRDRRRKYSKAFVFLAPSTIHGVGCFADGPILKGETVRCWDDRDSRWIPLREAHASPQVKLIKRFGIRSRSGYWSPINFLRISTGWYLNHSSHPNLVSTDGQVTYHALHDIPAGQELTIDYRLLDKWHDNLSRDELVREAGDRTTKTKVRRRAVRRT